MERAIFVYNPEAGKGTLKNKISDIVTLFRQKGLEVTMFPTLESGEAIRIVSEKAADYDRLICAGGDGTLHEVVHGLMELPRVVRPICGYIPTGTVNDFANGIKLPRRAMRAAEIAAGSAYHAYDVGEMNGKYFSYVTAFGAFTSVAYETPQFTKNILGKSAYILDGMTKLDTLRGIQTKVTTDKGTFEEKCILGMVTNAQSVGGLKLYRKTQVALDDGLVDGIFLKQPQNPIELNHALAFLMTGKINSQVHVIHANEIKIQTEEPTAYTLDGEDGGTHSLVHVQNHKQAITFCHGFK